MFFLLFSPLCSCFKSYEVKDGVCSGDPCKTRCIDYENSTAGQFCMAEPLFYFCYDPRLYFFIVWACFLVPVFLSLMISCCCLKKFRSPTCNFIVNFITGTLWSLVITAIYCLVMDNFNPANLIMVIIPGFLCLQFFCMFILGGVSCTNDPMKRQHLVRDSMRAKLYKRQDMELYITNMRRNPPVIQLAGELKTSRHVVTHTSNGVRSGTQIVTTPFQEFHPYVSWEERADAVKIPKNSKLLFVITKCKFKYSENLYALIDQKRNQMAHVASMNGGVATVKRVDFIQGLIPIMLGEGTEDTPSIQKFTRSCFGKFLWYFLAIFGLNTVYETIYASKVTVMKLKCRKYVSDLPDMHCPAYYADAAAPTLENPMCDLIVP